MNVEVMIRIEVTPEGHNPTVFNLSEGLARALRAKLNNIFGPDVVTKTEWHPVYPVVPQPLPEPTTFPWGQPSITCGHLGAK